jgi:hypothetical protein
VQLRCGVNDISTGFRVWFKFKEIGHDCRRIS